MTTTPTSAQRYAAQRSTGPRVRQDSPPDLTHVGPQADSSRIVHGRRGNPWKTRPAPKIATPTRNEAAPKTAVTRETRPAQGHGRTEKAGPHETQRARGREWHKRPDLDGRGGHHAGTSTLSIPRSGGEMKVSVRDVGLPRRGPPGRSKARRVRGHGGGCDQGRKAARETRPAPEPTHTRDPTAHKIHPTRTPPTKAPREHNPHETQPAERSGSAVQPGPRRLRRLRRAAQSCPAGRVSSERGCRRSGAVGRRCHGRTCFWSSVRPVAGHRAHRYAIGKAAPGRLSLRHPS